LNSSVPATSRTFRRPLVAVFHLTGIESFGNTRV
jgi:hypothetical protein